MMYALSVIVSFCAVFLKGFQHKNVIGGHIKSVAITSYFMAVFDVAAVSLIVSNGWWTALTAGTGASLGMVASILLHDWIYGPKEPACLSPTK